MILSTYLCKTCNDPFKARKADRDRGWARYCSKSCKAIKQIQKTDYYGPKNKIDLYYPLT